MDSTEPLSDSEHPGVLYKDEVKQGSSKACHGDSAQQALDYGLWGKDQPLQWEGRLPEAGIPSGPENSVHL